MKKLPLTGVLLMLTFCMSSQAKWVSPVDRYKESYKDYLNATCPIPHDEIQHFVYFARDREKLKNHPLLTHSRFAGAQIMYAWAQLENQQGEYDFSLIQEDYAYLKSKGKKLFIQLQDATFNPDYRGIPAYLTGDAYDKGAIIQRDDNGKPEGWVAKRWNKKVQERFTMLLKALGQQFDGKIEGINLQESAIGVSQKYDPTFTPKKYAESLKVRMKALKAAFPQSVTMQYANFMPGEWLPWEDEGYLQSIYQYGEEIGVGLGAPDLMVTRRGQLNHAIAMMHEHDYTVPLGIAIQDGNYIGQTNTHQVQKERHNLVPLLHGFAQGFMHVNYMFWVDQAPYFEEDVLTCFTE